MFLESQVQLARRQMTSSFAPITVIRIGHPTVMQPGYLSLKLFQGCCSRPLLAVWKARLLGMTVMQKV